jgi:hypothetical protein
MTYANITVAASSNIGTYYAATGFPAVGSSLAAGESITITMAYAPHMVGSTSSLFSFWSNGGFIDLLLTGTAPGVFCPQLHRLFVPQHPSARDALLLVCSRSQFRHLFAP